MEQTTDASVPSDRVRAAQLAREAALATPGVLRLDAGTTGLITTVGGGVKVPGVTSAMAPEGGFDVSVHLVCALVALPPVAEAVRRAVHTLTDGAGIALAGVNVVVADVELPGAQAA